MNKESLMKMAEEVNSNLQVDPPIKANTKSTFESLFTGIKQAVETFEGKARLSKATIDFLCEKEVDVPANIKILEKKKTEKKSVKNKKPGVIAEIIHIISSEGPVSKEKILKKLIKKFPDREEQSMSNTINLISIWSRRDSNRPNITKNKEGNYIKK